LVVHHRAAERVSVALAANGANFRDVVDMSVAGAALRRGWVTLGADYEAGGFGLSAMLRTEDNSTAEEPGHGGRLMLRSQGDRWSARVVADVQQQAATLDVNVPGALDVAAQVADLGLTAASPEDVLQVFAARGGRLAQQGASVGSLRIDPLRVQGALDLAWRPWIVDGAEIGMRVAVNEFGNPIGPQRTYIGRLYGSLKLFSDVDVTASYASGLLQREPTADDDVANVVLIFRRPL
jgi:hypothetical protein